MSFETSFYSVRTKQSFIRSSLKFSYSYKQKFPLSKFMVSKNYCFRKSVLFSPFSSKKDTYRFAKISLAVRAPRPKLRVQFYKAYKPEGLYQLCTKSNRKLYKANTQRRLQTFRAALGRTSQSNVSALDVPFQRTWTLQSLQTFRDSLGRTSQSNVSALDGQATQKTWLTRLCKCLVCMSFVRGESGEVLKENFTDVFYTNSEVIAFSLFQNFALPFFSISNNFSKNSCFFIRPTKYMHLVSPSVKRPDAASQKYFNSRTKVASEQSLCDGFSKKLTSVHFKMRYLGRTNLIRCGFKPQTKPLRYAFCKAELCMASSRLVKSTLFKNPVWTSPLHKRSKQGFAKVWDAPFQRRNVSAMPPSYKSKICCWTEGPKATQRTCRLPEGETRCTYKFVRAIKGLYRRVRPNRRFICKERAFVSRFVCKKKARQDTLAKAHCCYKAKNSVQEDRLTSKNLVSLNLKIGDYLSSGDKIGYISQHDIYRLKQPKVFAQSSFQRFCSKSNTTKIQKFGGHTATFKTPLIVPFSGRVLTVSKTQLIIQKTQPVLFYDSANLHVKRGEWVKEGTPILTLTHQTLITGDIVQGIPRIEQLFEAFTSPPPGLKERKGITQSKFKNVHDTLHSQVRDIFRKHWLKNVLPIAVRKSLEEIQYNIVEMIQKVYLSQGVLIADKHIEIIIRQMTSKGQILDSGSTGLLLEEVLPIRQIENANITTPGKKCLYIPAVVGLTTAALTCDSFISAASFQETTRVLSRDAVAAKSDFLRGLKEKVVIGDLISAGTGLDIYFIYTLFAECVPG